MSSQQTEHREHRFFSQNGVSKSVIHTLDTSMNVEDGDDQKYRGGYYTPTEIAKFLARWAIHRNVANVLEPSAGDGQIVGAIADALNGGGEITAVELYREEAQKVASRGGERCKVIEGDFFAWYLTNRPDSAFDAVLGNPPFIRYQQFSEEHRQPAFALMREEGLHPTRLVNAWLPFVTAATRALKKGGKLALVLPAELLQVKFASELRSYLASKYSHLTLVTFRKLLFPRLQQETLLLLGTRQDGASAKVSLVELDGPDDLKSFDIGQRSTVKQDLHHSSEKWTQYYLSSTELSLIREIQESEAFPRLGDLAEVDVGIVTGKNDFFVVTEDEARTNGITEWCLPLVSKAAQIRGVMLRENQWQEMAANGAKCYLVQLGHKQREQLTPAALKYVIRGEDQGFHHGYKCRIRMPEWWNVPSVWSPDAFLTRQIHDGPRIVHNPSGLTCTDTIHRVRAIGSVDASQIAAASMNSLTFAFAELRGRSYGGGVLELEPTEAESLPLPPLDLKIDIEWIDWLAREVSTELVLDHADRQVLEPAGLSRGDAKKLRGIWRKLFARRLRRNRG